MFVYLQRSEARQSSNAKIKPPDKELLFVNNKAGVNVGFFAFIGLINRKPLSDSGFNCLQCEWFQVNNVMKF